MIGEQKKRGPVVHETLFVPQYRRHDHGRMGSPCLFDGVGAIDLGIYQWIFRTIQLLNPVCGNQQKHANIHLWQDVAAITVLLGNADGFLPKWIIKNK